MAPQKVVLEANEVAKWYLKEDYSERAEKLRVEYVSGGIAIISPALLEYEALNALKYSGFYSRLELVKIARLLNKYGFECWRLKCLLKEETVRLAAKYDMIIYDANYLASANTMKAKFFFSCEEELLERVADLKMAKHLIDMAEKWERHFSFGNI